MTRKGGGGRGLGSREGLNPLDQSFIRRSLLPWRPSSMQAQPDRPLLTGTVLCVRHVQRGALTLPSLACCLQDFTKRFKTCAVVGEAAAL